MSDHRTPSLADAGIRHLANAKGVPIEEDVLGPPGKVRGDLLKLDRYPLRVRAAAR